MLDAVGGLFLHLGEDVAYDLRGVVGCLGWPGYLSGVSNVQNVSKCDPISKGQVTADRHVFHVYDSPLLNHYFINKPSAALANNCNSHPLILLLHTSSQLFPRHKHKKLTSTAT